MKKLSCLLSLLFLSFFLLQCQKELAVEDNIDVVDNTTTLQPIITHVQGNIVDENGQPAAGVTITAGARTATTNANGYFRINNAVLDRKAALVTAEKAGYFKGIRQFSATAGTNQVVIQLIKKNLAGTVSATAGGNAILPNGAVIGLPANGVVQASSGSGYSGPVNIYASYIDPSAASIGRTVPGSFAAVDKNGKRVVLTSYGMLAVELESTSGEKLQIKPGAAATLTAPIPAAGLASAPATIPLWYVDEQTGFWKEEGTATKQGNNYVGEVKHFSFWNYDVSANASIISLKVVNAKGVALVHVPVRITRTTIANGYNLTMGYTDSLGKVSGYVPSGENLLVEILDPCGNPVYSQNIPPLSQNTDVGLITVPASATSVLSYTGKLLNCNGDPVTNGFAIISFNNMVRYAKTDGNGNFETSFIVCPGSATTSQLIGVDQQDQQQSATATVAVTLPITNAPNTTTCGISTVQFINYSVNGVNYSISSATGDSLMAYPSAPGNTNNSTTNGLTISGLQIANNNVFNKISISVANVTGVGAFPLTFLSAQNISGAPNPAANVTLTRYAATAGQFYEGSFTAQIRDSSGNNSNTVISTFKVRRSN